MSLPKGWNREILARKNRFQLNGRENALPVKYFTLGQIQKRSADKNQHESQPSHPALVPGTSTEQGLG